MSRSTADRQSAIRSFFTATSHWIDTYSRSSMSSAEALAMRDAILSQQWEHAAGKNTGKDKPARTR